MCLCSGNCQRLSLCHAEPWRFVTSQWQHPGVRSLGYVCYRLSVAAFFFCWTVLDAATYGDYGQRSKWLVHVTNWSKMLVMIDTLLQALFTCHYQLYKLRKRNSGSGGEPEHISFPPILVFFYGIEWFFTNVSGVFALVTVNVAFIEADTTGSFRAARYFCSLLYVLADHLLNNQPKRLSHVLYSLALHLFYVLVNAVYALAGGTTGTGESVVDGVDWTSPALASGYVTISLLLVFLAQLLLWLLVRLRELIYSCVSDRHAIKLRLGGDAVVYGATSTQDLEARGQVNPAAETDSTAAARPSTPSTKEASPVPTPSSTSPQTRQQAPPTQLTQD